MRGVHPTRDHSETKRVSGCAGAFLAFLQADGLDAKQRATLSVNVTDQSGAAIPQAEVKVKKVETGAKRSDPSNAGLAVIPGLAAGSYELTIEAAQFCQYRGTLTLTEDPGRGRRGDLPHIF
jgi:cytoskeletal protein RodZ